MRASIIEKKKYKIDVNDVTPTSFFTYHYSFETTILYKDIRSNKQRKRQDVSNINLLNIQVKYTYRSFYLNEVYKD